MIPDRGVDFYITGTEIVEVHFPNGDLACQWCPFLQAENLPRKYPRYLRQDL